MCTTSICKKNENNKSTELICLTKRTKVAKSFYSRLKGLMFQSKLQDCDSLLITPCNSIHTFFMLMSIDVVFIAKDKKVVKIFRNLKAWRMTRIYFKAKHVLEMPAGTLTSELQEGDMLVYV